MSNKIMDVWGVWLFFIIVMSTCVTNITEDCDITYTLWYNNVLTNILSVAAILSDTCHAVDSLVNQTELSPLDRVQQLGPPRGLGLVKCPLRPVNIFSQLSDQASIWKKVSKQATLLHLLSYMWLHFAYTGRLVCLIDEMAVNPQTAYELKCKRSFLTSWTKHIRVALDVLIADRCIYILCKSE